MNFSENMLMEYFAHRISAPFGKNEISDMVAELVKTSVQSALSKKQAAISRYRRHANISHLLEEVSRHILFPVQNITRLIGHLDGLESRFNINDYIDESPEKHFFERYIIEAQSSLHVLWETRDSWEDLTLFAPLNKLCKDLLYAAGLQLSSLPDGKLWVSVP